MKCDVVEIVADLRAMHSVAHNFYVTVKPWLHHESPMLTASIKDLEYMLAKIEMSDKYNQAGQQPDKG